jgi:hypothetical protein
MTEKFKHKLSTARGVERSRVWLERGRLDRAGFTHGTTFRKTWDERRGVLVLDVAKPGKDDKAGDFGMVAGKPERPIIDIVGERVREFFSKGTHVLVIYDGDAKRITVKPA